MFSNSMTRGFDILALVAGPAIVAVKGFRFSNLLIPGEQVMKTPVRILSVLLLLVALPCFGWSDDVEEGDGIGSEVKEKKPAPVPEAVTACKKNLTKIDLTKKQKEQLEALIVSTSEAYAEAGENDKDEIIKDFKYQVAEYLLNEAQREKLGLTNAEEKPETPKRVAAFQKKLEVAALSEEQQRQVKRLVEEASVAYAEPKDEEGKKEALRDFRYGVAEYVLTEEQREKLGLKAPKKESITPRQIEAVRKRLAALDLGKEQKEELESLLGEAAEAFADAESEEAKKEILKDLRYGISEYVLTKEQREKLKQSREKQRNSTKKKPEADAKSKEDGKSERKE
jgi:hypothetical protein